LSQDQALSDLIGSIYDCAIDPSLWSDTLRQVAAFLDSSLVSIDVLSSIPGHPPIISQFEYGFPAGAREEFLLKYGATNPLTPAGMLYDPGEVATSREMLGEDIIELYPVYTEWAVPNGMIEMMAGVIRKDAARIVPVSVSRRERYGEPEKHKLRLLLPHFRRSVTIAELIDDKTVERNRFQQVIDRLSIAVFLVDSSGLVRHANPSGQALLRDGGALRSRNGRLSTQHPHEQTALLAAIAAGATGSQSVALTSASGEPLVASILPLDEGFRREASGSPYAAAAVFINNPPGRFEWPGEMMAKLFRLTGAELQILFALLDGATIQQSADRFGIALSTVKTHLKRIFAKTGTSRQIDLVRKAEQLMPQVRR
jgi:DNA-binding CsgD family transcriptional regulator